MSITQVRELAARFGTGVLSSRCPSPKTSLELTCPRCGHPFKTTWATFRQTKNGCCQSCNKPVGSRNGAFKAFSPEERQARADRLKAHQVWAKAVMERDGYRCVITGLKATPRRPLTAHHLENWADNPSLRDAPSNGVTLRQNLHREFHSLYGNTCTSLQFEEFKAMVLARV